MPRKTPQEKKRQSYLKDRRNTYAENSKSSRSAIRLHKRHVNQANRRAVHQAMSRAATGYDPEIAEQAESRLAGKRHKRSEEHTSELQSRPHIVCRLLLEKK